mgnify:CR=1 FL=1
MIYIVNVYVYTDNDCEPSHYIAGVCTDLVQLENELAAQGLSLSDFACEYRDGTLISAVYDINDKTIDIEGTIPNILDDLTS